MSTRRRIKHVDYDDDDVLDSDDYEVDRPVQKLQKAKPKPTVKRASPKRAQDEPAEFRSERSRAIARQMIKNKKTCTNLVVVGHVDAGKSTLVGHLLLQMEAVTIKQINTCRAESAASHKSSFVFAFVMDEGEDERQRGVTIDVCIKYFETENRIFTVFDAPGHADFIPNMILGSMQADAALLVVDVADFDAGFFAGRTKEHCQLVKALGIRNVVVAVNKMDLVQWDEQKFQHVRRQLHEFLTAPGHFRFENANLQYVPISAFEGTNLKLSAPDLMPWSKQTLLNALDSIGVEAVDNEEFLQQPARAIVVESIPGRQATTVAVKVTAGVISVNELLLALPSDVKVTCKKIKIRGEFVNDAVGGDYVEEIQLQAPLDAVPTGSVLVGQGKQPKIGKQIRARVVAIDPVLPICQGQTVSLSSFPKFQLLCHLHAEHEPVTVLAIEKGLNKQTGEPLKTKPKALQSGDFAIVLLQFTTKIVYEFSGPLSRVLLRDRGRTAAAGVIVEN